MYKEYPEKEVCIMVDDANEIKSKIYDLLVSLVQRSDNKEYAIDYTHDIIEYVEQLDDIINHLDYELEKRDEMLDSLIGKTAKLLCKEGQSDNSINTWLNGRTLVKKTPDEPLNEGEVSIRELNNFLERQRKVEEAIETLEEVLE